MKYTENTPRHSTRCCCCWVAFDVTVEQSAVAQVAQPEADGRGVSCCRFCCCYAALELRHIPIGVSSSKAQVVKNCCMLLSVKLIRPRLSSHIISNYNSVEVEIEANAFCGTRWQSSALLTNCQSEKEKRRAFNWRNGWANFPCPLSFSPLSRPAALGVSV